jgi:CheY-like chemotaxis protein
MNSTRAANILLVEDNLDDIRILRRALTGRRMLAILHVARDGQEALDFLFPEGAEEPKKPTPDLILLDLNLPRMNGIDVLKMVRSSKDLAGLPIIMLTSSTREEDVSRSYKAGSNTYVQKPVDFDDFVKALELIEDYWTGLAKLPAA